MLQARLFNYADAQRYRLGVNYRQIPVNRPRCPVHSNQRDGQGREMVTTVACHTTSQTASANGNNNQTLLNHHFVSTEMQHTGIIVTMITITSANLVHYLT